MACARSRFTSAPILLLLAIVAACVPDPEPFDLVIANGRVMDPESGLDAARHIGVAAGSIAEISPAPLIGRDTVDATGLVVAPGFIDLNTYQHGDPLFRLRAADGVTSVLNLEAGATDVDVYYRALEGRALVHFGAAVDHESVRHVAVGDSTLSVIDGVNEERGLPELDLQPLTAEELDALAVLVRTGFLDGAVALGFGLYYTPGATHSEVLRLAGIAAEHDAPVHMHTRQFDETRDWDELYEPFGLAIGAGAAVHIKHLQSTFGTFTDPALDLLDQARAAGLEVSTECYPYTASSTFIESAPFDDWRSWSDEQFQRFEWVTTGERLTRTSFGQYRELGGVVVIHAVNDEAQERAVRSCIAHPASMIASDGAWDGGRTHPRVAGTNSRVLGRYVREEGVLTLMAAIRQMSLLPALHLESRVPGMRAKGRLSVGSDADLVAFDPERVIDRATFSDPLRSPLGIETVIVLGVPVVRGGQIQDGVFPGRPIRGGRND